MWVCKSKIETVYVIWYMSMLKCYLVASSMTEFNSVTNSLTHPLSLYASSKNIWTIKKNILVKFISIFHEKLLFPKKKSILLLHIFSSVLPSNIIQVGWLVICSLKIITCTFKSIKIVRILIFSFSLIFIHSTIWMLTSFWFCSFSTIIV